MSKRRARSPHAPPASAREPAPPRWITWAWCGVLFVLVLATYGRLFSAEFTSWDDPETIKENPWFNPPSATGLAAAWTTPHMDLWVPVTYTVWWATAGVAWHEAGAAAPGLSPAPFHALNVLLHAVSACLVFLLLRRFRFGFLASGIAAALFALHPVQVESVGWTSGMKDVLFGCLSLATLLIYFAAVGHTEDRAFKLRRGWYALAVLTLIAAVMAKPTAMVVPVIAFVMDWLLRGNSVRRAALTALPLLLVMVPFAIVARNVQSVPDEQGTVPLMYRPLVATDALAFYLGKIAAPIAMAPDYGRAPAVARAEGWIYWTWVVPLAAAFAVVIAWRRKNTPVPAAALAIFILGLGPVLGLVRFDFQNFSTVADHYLYLPMLGVALLAAWGVQILLGRALVGAARRAAEGQQRLQIVVPVAILLLVVLAIRSFDQCRYWLNTRSLWEHTLAVNPNSAAACNSLASQFINEGNGPQALPMAERALALRPFDVRNQVTTAVAYAMTGKFAEAERLYREALRTHPDEVRALANFSGLLAQQGHLAEALPLAERAVTLQPGNAQAHLNYGRMLWDSGRQSEGLAHAAEAVRLAPANTQARLNYGILLASAGRLPEAAEQFEALNRLQPGHPVAMDFLNEYRRRNGRGG